MHDICAELLPRFTLMFIHRHMSYAFSEINFNLLSINTKHLFLIVKFLFCSFRCTPWHLSAFKIQIYVPALQISWCAFLKSASPLRLAYILHGCDQGRSVCLTAQLAEAMSCSRNQAWNDAGYGVWLNCREMALQFCSYVPLSGQKITFHFWSTPL